MFGLFVQKHAEAASLYCNVQVLYIFADDRIKTLEFEENNFKNIKELIVYFPVNKRNPLHKIIKSINYLI